MHPHDNDPKITDIKGYDSLLNLALDLRFPWNRGTDAIWRELEPELWNLSHSPWAILQTVSREKLARSFADPKFTALVNSLLKRHQETLDGSTWFQDHYPNSALKCVAYFSMEFMLSEALPIYSGGLGNVAGDQLKAASDLGVPVIAIGLLYGQGYFRQSIDKNGEQQELYPHNDPGLLPIKPLRTADGEWLRIKIDLPGWSLWLRTWEVTIGRRKLYLLDSNDIANIPAHRGITSELYGGDKELRLKQELVLGICGWRLLEALGIQPDICHLNEGHAAFVALERAYSFMKKTKEPFEVALAATRVGNLFTTHTAVPAGFDRFPPQLIEKYLGDYAQTKLGITAKQLISLGQLHPEDDFNMALLAIRGSGFVNGVSQLHGVVSRQLFKDLFPRWPEEEVPVGFVTNGVHMPSWQSGFANDLWTEVCGKGLWHGLKNGQVNKMSTVSDEQIWQLRSEARSTLVNRARRLLSRQLSARGESKDTVEKSQHFLNPETLTLGFARRFASYKRPDLLLTDEDRLIRILMNPERPVQLVIAGKAHPADGLGHALIKKWMDFLSRPGVRSHVVFLSDYDMILAGYLVRGVDLWINTPQRPWEACGTSGMKVLVNGGLNFSELDGWWAEAYCPEVGWALGDFKEHGNDPGWDRAEANRLYELLEEEVIPEFYKRDKKNIPVGWVKKVRDSMSRLTPQFSADRAVREYTEKFYLPAADLFKKRTENKGSLATQIVEWRSFIEQNWEQLKFSSFKVETDQENRLVEVQVQLANLNPHAVKVELFSPALTKEMEYQGKIPNTPNGHIYRAKVPIANPVANFTARIVPYFPGVAVPLEANQILWQR